MDLSQPVRRHRNAVAMAISCNIIWTRPAEAADDVDAEVAIADNRRAALTCATRFCEVAHATPTSVRMQ
jgi:hypothetical protein